MDIILSSIFFKIAAFAVCCYFLAWITRRIVETAAPKLKCTGEPYPSRMSRWWNEVILYAIPVLFGIGLALSVRKTSYFPADFKELVPSIIFGVATGFMSGFFYKLLKRLLLKEAGAEKEEDLPTATVDPGGKA